MRLLLLCPDQIGPLMAGPAIRYHEMARALARSFDVTLASPYEVGMELEGVRRERLDAATCDSLLAGADAVVVQGLLMGRFPALRHAQVPLVIDLYDPMLLEGLHLYSGRPVERRTYSHERLLALTLAQLHAGDYFLVANRTQADFYMGMLAAVNRLNPEWADGGMRADRLIGVVPMGIPSSPPTGAGPVVKGVRPGFPADGPLLLWAGGLWEWMDPLTAIRAMALVHAQRPDARLALWGTRRPNADTPHHTMIARSLALAEELGLAGRAVFFEEWVPYAERGRWLLEADLGLSLSVPGLEARYANRARILDYLWAGVPVVATKGDPLAARLAREGTGVAVTAGRPDKLARVLLELLDDPARRASMRARIDQVRPRLTWERAVRPLERFLAKPTRDPCRGRLEYLGPLASLIAGERPIVGPLVKTGVNLVRHGVWDTLVKASRAGAEALDLALRGESPP